MNNDNDYAKMEKEMGRMHKAFVKGTGNTRTWGSDPATIAIYPYNNSVLGCTTYGFNARFGKAKLHRTGFATPHDASAYALNWVVEQSSIFTDKVCALYGAVLTRGVRA